MNQIDTPLRQTSAARNYGVLALLLIALHLAVGATVSLPTWRVTQDNNAAMEEALAWRSGRLDLARNRYEVARVEDKYYNVVGLAFTLIAFVGVSLSQLFGGPVGELYPPLFVAIVALPLPLIAYWAFGEVTRSREWSAVWTFYLVAGTCLLPILTTCGTGSIYYINHVLAVTGLLLLGGDLLGSKKGWPAAMGLLLAAWSRQTTMLYAIPFLWLFLGRRSNITDHVGRSSRTKWLAVSTVVLLIIVPGIFNFLKFGNPFTSGYRLLYEGRSDAIARRAGECFFGLANVPMHAWAMNVQWPRLDIRGGGLFLDVAGTQGVSIWLTNPLFIAVGLTIRRWWRDSTARALMLTTLVIVFVDLCYHTTGSQDSGYFRYALDYIPIWLLVMAKCLDRPSQRYCLMLGIAYSCLYFDVLR
jgi:hypothetical protein